MKSRLFAWISIAYVPILLLATMPATATFTPEEQQAIAQVRSFNTAFKAIAREVTPSVVTINVTKKREAVDQRRQRGFFWQPMPEERESTGSGIVMTPDGYILTNHHVAGDADKITVRLSDNREFDAELVGGDPRTDIAVVKIKTTGLKPANIGNSDAVDIGEWVLAVGAPLDLESTVTAGIISAVGRRINILRDQDGLSIEDFIQTDAAINPGNSGGALVNLNGEVIGVNTAIATPSGAFVGYGFAVPIDLAKKVMDDIVKHGEVKRGFLGVSLESVDAGKASAFGLDRPQGVLISQVHNGTPAAKAGLRGGDIILSVDGQDVNRTNQVQSLVARKRPGDTVALNVRRGTRNVAINATLGDSLPENLTAQAPAPAPRSSSETSGLGLTVQNITPELAQNHGISENAEGIIVTEVARDAQRAGFARGDVIFAVRQGNFEQNIRTVKDFENALKNLAKGRHAAFYVENSGRRRFVDIRIPE